MSEMADLTTRLDLRLVVATGASLPVSAVLSYDVADPYAVTVAFDTAGPGGDGQLVQWTFARELLAQGVTQRTGEGDVQVWPATVAGAKVVCLSLTSPSGSALFEFPLVELVEFVSRTFAAVPSGAESELVDVDAELASMLGDELGR